MVRLYDAEGNAEIGTLTDEQFQFLVDQMEEESPQDRDYYVSADTIDMLAEEGGDPAMLELLRRALGGRDGMDVRWERA